MRACTKSCFALVAAQGMDLESAKLAVDSARDTQLITLNKLLTPPELGTGSRSGSDSDGADDAEAHLQPYAVEQEPAQPTTVGNGGGSSLKQRPGREGEAAGATALQAVAANLNSAEAHRTTSQPAARGTSLSEPHDTAPQASAAGARSSKSSADRFEGGSSKAQLDCARGAGCQSSRGGRQEHHAACSGAVPPEL